MRHPPNLKVPPLPGVAPLKLSGTHEFGTLHTLPTTDFVDCGVNREASRESIFVSTSSRGVIDARAGFVDRSWGPQWTRNRSTWLQRGNSKPPRTNPRTRTGPLPVEQYELLLDGQRLLIIKEVILLNKVY